MSLPVHRSDTRHHDTNRASAFTRRTPSFLAVMLLLTSLVTTGCDVIDSNGPLYDETISAEARYATNGPPRWITPVPEVLPFPHEVKWPEKENGPVAQLVGTWQLATADVQALSEGSIPPTITFREDLLFTGYGTCYNFSGRYRAGSDGLLTVIDFRSYQKFCVEENDPIREALFRGLQEATDFRFEQRGTLRIISRGGKREHFFIFERIEEGTGDIGMPPAAGQ